MDKIIRLNENHIVDLAEIDFEADHANDRSRGASKAEMEKEIRKRFARGHEIFFGYKINNEFVGYVTFNPFFPGYMHCEVYWISVKKKCQGQGIGKKLMHFIEMYAKKKGFRKICVYTGKNMGKARKFYQMAGYKYINEFKGYYGFSSGNTTAVLYAKDL